MTDRPSRGTVWQTPESEAGQVVRIDDRRRSRAQHLDESPGERGTEASTVSDSETVRITRAELRGLLEWAGFELPDVRSDAPRSPAEPRFGSEGSSPKGRKHGSSLHDAVGTASREIGALPSVRGGVDIHGPDPYEERTEVGDSAAENPGSGDDPEARKSLAEQISEVLGGSQALGGETDGLAGLRDRIREGLPVDCLEAVADRLDLDSEEITVLLSLSPRTLSRRRKTGRLAADESDRLFRVARITARAIQALGNLRKASIWLREPNRALGGLVPIQLLDTDAGTKQVEQILGRIEHGVFS